jgi:hypothetical protein
MFIRNGIKAGYTFMEAIENVLPFVDEFFILDGRSDDGTFEALTSFGKRCNKIRIESTLPDYLAAKKDERGILLGAAFDEARQNCNGDWLVQVQADTVFFPITVLAARYFLMQKNNAEKFEAIKVIRHQYRWNWQEKYREDMLNLIFKKSAGKVFGDAIDIEVQGKISKNLLGLFKKYPATDNAWIFFENLIGKIEGCFEIWPSHEKNIMKQDFEWYNKTTGRSFNEDINNYYKKKILPPFWQTNESPFKDILPDNLWGLIGKKKYEIEPRFSNQGQEFRPSIAQLLEMLAKINAATSPFAQFVKLWN